MFSHLITNYYYTLINKILTEATVFSYNWVFLENEVDTFKSNSQLIFWEHKIGDDIFVNSVKI